MSDDRKYGLRWRECFPTPRRAEPDAHGQAALILAETILHALVESRSLTLAQAIDVARTAAEVKIEIAEEIDESEGTMRRSVGLLARIEQSLTAGQGGSGLASTDFLAP